MRIRARVRHLNYNHLHYFWVVATTGSIARAAESLHVTPQTISGQLRTLEARLGARLFRRTGRKLGLTETGRVVHSYADPMFTLGFELGEVLQHRAPSRPGPLAIGVASGVGKLIAFRLLSPVLDLPASAPVLCCEATSESLVAALLSREIDLAVTDEAVASGGANGVRSHLVGQCGLTIFCAAAAAQRYRARFPASLHGAPFVVPARNTALAKSLAGWFRSQHIAPSIVAEIESPDLISVVCEKYSALFAAPTAIAREIERTYRVAVVGEVPEVEQSFYVAYAERHPRRESFAAVVTTARGQFRKDAPPRAATEATEVRRVRGSGPDPITHTRNGTAAIRLVE